MKESSFACETPYVISRVWRAAAVSIAPVLHTDNDFLQLHEILGRRPIMRQRQGVAIRVVASTAVRRWTHP